MGTWSAKIFDDDGAMDIKGEYEILLGYGLSPQEVYKKIEECFYPDYQDVEEDVYWLSIALYQWQNGILMDEVKEKAIECIEDEEYLERWKGDEKVYAKRKKVLEDLKNKLLYKVNPVKKKFPKCPIYYRRKTKWKVGDLLAYKMTAPMEPWENDERAAKYISAQEQLRKGILLLRVIKVSE